MGLYWGSSRTCCFWGRRTLDASRDLTKDDGSGLTIFFIGDVHGLESFFLICVHDCMIFVLGFGCVVLYSCFVLLFSLGFFPAYIDHCFLTSFAYPTPVYWAHVFQVLVFRAPVYRVLVGRAPAYRVHRHPCFSIVASISMEILTFFRVVSQGCYSSMAVCLLETSSFFQAQ